MKLKDILTPSFKDCTAGRSKERQHTSIAEQCLSADTDFCRETVAQGLLTEAQMAHAAQRYRLGSSKSGKCIFWMMDEQGRLRDGRLDGKWVSVMLKARESELQKRWYTEHCLFGLHLLAESDQYQPVAIIESEASAVILSELFPEQLWLATMYPVNFTIDRLAPLCGRTVTLFPRADLTATDYTAWLEIADQARRRYHLDISVSTVLEDNTTQEQKLQQVDLVGYLFDQPQENSLTYS